MNLEHFKFMQAQLITYSNVELLHSILRSLSLVSPNIFLLDYHITLCTTVHLSKDMMLQGCHRHAVGPTLEEVQKLTSVTMILWLSLSYTLTVMAYSLPTSSTQLLPGEIENPIETKFRKIMLMNPTRASTVHGASY